MIIVSILVVGDHGGRVVLRYSLLLLIRCVGAKGVLFANDDDEQKIFFWQKKSLDLVFAILQELTYSKQHILLFSRNV